MQESWDDEDKKDELPKKSEATLTIESSKSKKKFKLRRNVNVQTEKHAKVNQGKKAKSKAKPTLNTRGDDLKYYGYEVNEYDEFDDFM